MDLSSSGSWSRGGLVGRQIGPYQVLNEIARGGQGVVLEVRHLELDYRAALKLLTAVTPQGAARFQHEAQVLARLDHPQVPKLRDHGVMGATPFIALELVEGPTLERALGQGLVTREQAVELIEIVAETLEDCHVRGIVHRDLKPGNIVVGEDLTPWLLDFGLAKGQQDQSLSMTGEIVGTPGFLAPEQCGGEVSEQADPRTDVYGLGALLYFALTGVQPFDGASVVNVIKKVLEEEPVHPQEYEPDTPRSLSRICLQALSKDPAERHQSAGDFAAALAKWRRYGDRDERSGLVRALTVLILLGALGLGAALAPRLGPSGAIQEPNEPSKTSKTSKPSPTATPTREVVERARGAPLPDPRYRIRWSMSAPERHRHGAVSVGPWVVVTHGKGRWALRPRDGERVDLPPGGAHAWDAVTRRFVFLTKGEVQAWDPERDALTSLGTIQHASGLTTAGSRVVLTTSDRRVACLSSDGRPVWSVPVSGRIDAPPLALDLDGSGDPDHVLYATAQGEAGLIGLGDGAVRCVARLPGPVRHAPILLGARNEADAVPVLAVCGDGHVARLDVSRAAITVRRIVTLHHAVRAAPVLVRRANKPFAVALGLGSWGIAAVRVDGSEVAWAHLPPRAGAWATDVAAVDLDGDGQEEVGATWDLAGKESFLTIHDSAGHLLEDHAPEGRPWNGVAAGDGVLVAVRKGRIEAWGWRQRWEQVAPKATLRRARFLLISGAWSAARAEGKALGGRQGHLLAAFARVQIEGPQAMLAVLTAADPREISSELIAISRAAGHGLAGRLAMQRFQGAVSGGQMPVAAPQRAGQAVTVSPLRGAGVPREVRVGAKQIEARGFLRVGVSDDQARFGRHTFNTGGWLGVRLKLEAPQRFRLGLRHQTVGSYGWGFCAVTVKLDGKVIVPSWSAPRGLSWDSVDLPPLSVGEHRLVVEVQERTATIYELRGLRLEPLPAR